MTFLPYTYLVELVQLILAVEAVVLSAWMCYDTWRDLYHVRISSDVPGAWLWQGYGNFLTECVRCTVAVQLVGIGIYAVSTSSDYGPVNFWSWQANVNVWRLLAAGITFCVMMESLIARYCRRRADLANGIYR